MNYKVTRIGLLNFWYFDDEVFNFFDGKLLLRGENGSGKSVTMQSFIPLILDGNRMPSRLDPFGTKEKKIEDYLLGPSDGEQKDDSIGYLYMETYNEEKDKYITIGIGLYARKGRPTDFWGFAIKDGRRIGIDIQLYKSYSSKILMTKKELKVNLGTDNDFVETAKEYKALVNDLLFGFDDIEQYDEFINVLLQLRSSKLSKEYNPTKLMNILSSVLQPLTDDDIRPLSEAIEDTNKTREKVEQLSSSLKDLANLSKTYNNYNETILYNKAKSYKETKKSIKDINKTIDDTSNQISKIKNRLDEIESNLGNLDIESTEIETKLASIDNTELKDYTEQLNDLKVKIEDIECAINNLKSKIENKNDKINKYTEMINDKEKEIFDKEKEILSDKNEIVLITDELNLLDIKHSINDKEINFTYLEERINKYKNKLKEILAKLEEVEKLKDKINDKEVENEEISKNLKDKEKDKEEQLKLKYEEIDKFKDELNLLYKMNIIDFSLEKKKIIFDLIDDYSTFNYGKAKDEYQKEIKFYEMSTINEIEKVKNKIENESKELDNVNKELDELKNKKEIEYVEEEITKYSENVLNELNIPFTYLYKVIEFKDNILEDEKDKIEELLISMNILNAKLVPSKYLNDVNGIKSIFLKKGKYKDNNLKKPKKDNNPFGYRNNPFANMGENPFR